MNADEEHTLEMCAALVIGTGRQLLQYNLYCQPPPPSHASPYSARYNRDSYKLATHAETHFLAETRFHSHFCKVHYKQSQLTVMVKKANPNVSSLRRRLMKATIASFSDRVEFSIPCIHNRATKERQGTKLNKTGHYTHTRTNVDPFLSAIEAVIHL